MVMTLKNAIFWDVTPCGCFKNQCFGGILHFHHRVEKIKELGTVLAVTSN
jgi:hypothetical protein